MKAKLGCHGPWCLLLFVSMPSACAERRDDSPRFVLDERTSIPLDDTLQVRGGVIGPRGTIFIWTVDAVLRIGSPTRLLCTGVAMKPIAISVIASDSAIVILDQTFGQFLRSEQDGACEPIGRVHFSVRPHGGVSTGGRWVVAGLDTLEAAFIAGLTSDFKASWRRDLPTVFRDPNGPAFWIAPAPEGIVLASLHVPQDILVFDSLGTQKRAHRWAPTGIADSATAWVGLGALSIGPHLMLAAADLASDRRRFTILDEKGRAVRDLSLDVSLGFLASNAARRELLALRRTDRLELVIYRWQWQAPR